MSSAADEILSEFQRYLRGIGDGELRGFLAEIDWTMPPRPLSTRTLPCIAHLANADVHAAEQARPLVRLLQTHGAAMHWGQTYTVVDFGQHFIDNYGWLELFGTRGHFANDRVAAGFLILGPGIIYPDHHHEAEEIYLPLSGTAFWRKGDGPYLARAPGEVIHHPSNINHSMRTDAEPLLALYLWRGGPLAARSTIATKPGNGT